MATPNWFQLLPADLFHYFGTEYLNSYYCYYGPLWLGKDRHSDRVVNAVEQPQSYLPRALIDHAIKNQYLRIAAEKINIVTVEYFMDRCITYQSHTLLRLAMNNHPICPKKQMEYALRTGSVALAQSAVSRGAQIDQKAIRLACRHGGDIQSYFLEQAEHQSIVLDSDTVLPLFHRGDLEIIHRLYKRKLFRVGRIGCDDAVPSGNLNLVLWIDSTINNSYRRPNIRSRHCSLAAARHNKLQMLVELHKLGTALDEGCYIHFAKHRNLCAMNWLREKRCWIPHTSDASRADTDLHDFLAAWLVDKPFSQIVLR